jgi:DNA topoisomerase IA
MQVARYLWLSTFEREEKPAKATKVNGVLLSRNNAKIISTFDHLYEWRHEAPLEMAIMAQSKQQTASEWMDVAHALHEEVAVGE